MPTTLAARRHPAWEQLSKGARALQARNVGQIIGPHPAAPAPAAFVLCWTPDSSLDGRSSRSGGTGQALRIAVSYDVPVFNLCREDHRTRINAFVANSR